MPLQNSATPSGEIIAVPDRGMFLGNRGVLHDHQRQFVRQNTSYKAWVICLTKFKDRKRDLMTPGIARLWSSAGPTTVFGFLFPRLSGVRLSQSWPTS